MISHFKMFFTTFLKVILQLLFSRFLTVIWNTIHCLCTDFLLVPCIQYLRTESCLWLQNLLGTRNLLYYPIKKQKYQEILTRSGLNTVTLFYLFIFLFIYLFLCSRIKVYKAILYKYLEKEKRTTKYKIVLHKYLTIDPYSYF